MKAKKLGMVWVVVDNLGKAIEFYTQSLGLNLLEKNDQYGWAELGTEEEGVRLGLGQKNDIDAMEPGSNAVFALEVANLESAISDLKARKTALVGDILEIPGHVKMQMCTDTDGNRFQIVEKLG